MYCQIETCIHRVKHTATTQKPTVCVIVACGYKVYVSVCMRLMLYIDLLAEYIGTMSHIYGCASLDYSGYPLTHK